MSDAYPRVIPVLVYWQHWTEHREDYDDWDFDDEWDLVERAHHRLECWSDDGSIGTHGVEVGGVMVERNTLRRDYDI